MNVAPSEARSLTFGEYQALVFQHNLRLDPKGNEEPVEAPSDDEYEEMEAAVEAMGLGGMVH